MNINSNINSSQQLELVKQLFKNKEYKKCYQMLINMKNDNPQDYQVLYGLGKVCDKLDEKDDAWMYFQASMFIDDKNPSKLNKIGEFLMENHNLNQAEKMFLKCINIAPNNKSCLCNLGKLNELLDKYDVARKYYQQCLQIDSKLACVNYYLGKLLLNNYKQNELLNAKHLLETACNLAPNIDMYQIEYEKCIKILNDNQQQKINQNKVTQNNSDLIKVIIYNFDNLFMFNPSNGNEIPRNMNNSQLTREFGGQDRIIRMQQHFYNLTKKKSIKTFQLVSIYPETVVIDLLKHMCIQQYFIVNDSIHVYNEDIVNHVIRLNQEYNYSCNQILYIDDIKNIYIMDQLCNKCKTIWIEGSNFISNHGLQLQDFEIIEVLFGVAANRRIYGNKVRFPWPIPKSLSSFNENTYNAIKNEIFSMSMNYFRSVTTLDTVRFIQDKWKHSKYLECFIDFAYKFADLRRSLRQKDYWIAISICCQLIEMEPSDFDITSRFAECCSKLHLDDVALHLYEKSIGLNPNSFRIHEKYANHLFYAQKNYFEAAKHYNICFKMKGDILDIYFLFNYAKCCHWLDLHDRAEKYYTLCINLDTHLNLKKSSEIHYGFGNFLCNHPEQRLVESKYHFSKAVEYVPNNAYNQWRLSSILYKLNEIDQSLAHLQKALEINPNHQKARNDWYRHYHQQYSPYNNIQNDNNNGYNQPNDDNSYRNMEMKYDDLDYKQQSYNSPKTQNNQQRTGVSDHNHSTRSAFDQSGSSQTTNVHNTQNIYKKAFHDKYMERFGDYSHFNKEKTQKYLRIFMLREINDIRVIKNNSMEEIQSLIKNHFKDDNVRNQMVAFFENLKTEYQVFKTWLEVNGFVNNCYINLFEIGGIFSLDSLKNHIKTKNDLQILVDAFEKEFENGQKIENDKVDKLWSIIQLQ